MQQSLIELMAYMAVGGLIFTVIFFPVYLIGRIRKRKRLSFTIAGTGARSNQAGAMPLVGARVRTTILQKGEEVEAVGTLKAYGFVNGGTGFIKYLVNAEIGGQAIDHLIDVRGSKGLSSWFTSQDVTEPDQWMKKLGLSSTKYDDLQVFGTWDKNKPAWRR